MDLFGEDPIEPADESFIDEALLPEPEGLSPPQQSTLCLGHEDTERYFIDLCASNTMPHGMIFAGLKGIGKSTLAFRLARALLKHGKSDPSQDDMFGDTPSALESLDVDPEHQAFRLIASGAHPDMLVIGREEGAKGVAVDDIRKVAPFLRLTASESGWRIVIIDDADTMTRASQNALLKILEEPPEHALIILIAHRPGALIPTIRSRTQTLNLQPPSLESFETLVSKAGQPLLQEELKTLHALSYGSIGNALEYIENGGLDTLSRLMSLFETYPRWDWEAIHVTAEEMARTTKGNAYQNFASLYLWVFNALVEYKARGQAPALNILQKPFFDALLRQSSLESLLEICENLEAHFRKTEFANLDKKQAVLQSFMILDSQLPQ